jgi:hypothetical protein
MKFLLVGAILSSVSAFHVAPRTSRVLATPLFSTVEGEQTSASVSTSLAKTELLETARSLNDEYGCLLIDSGAQDKLRAVVEKLEMVTDPPTETDELLGSWTLLCATASASLQGGPLDKIGGIDTSKIPFYNESPIKKIRDTLNKSVKVEQVIKSVDSDGIDRVDHVIDYFPPDSLSDFLESLPDAIKMLNINPLQISESKVTLIHKAQIESTEPVIKTKLSLTSIVVNVAGKSKVLSPEGADVLGVNLPFGDFLNTGSFETTYMDDKLRISRSKIGIVDQLRVFIRSELETGTVKAKEEKEEEEDYLEEDGDDIAPSDVSDASPSD